MKLTTGLVSNSGSFPYMAQESFEVKPGHHNLIALSGMRVDADENMRNLDVNGRNCIFYDEASHIKMYRNYTFANCIFECNLLIAYHQYNCIPWYFPTPDNNTKLCNPWEAKEFISFMHSIKSEKCSHCLPDCNNTIYRPSIMTLPFRPCDVSNMEMSLLCKISRYWYAPNPKKYYTQIGNSPTIDDLFYGNDQKSNIRAYNVLNKEKNVFKTNDLTYDAFDVDIATVEIYFETPSVIQMGRQSKMTWVDYLSNVGGLMGLVQACQTQTTVRAAL